MRKGKLYLGAEVALCVHPALIKVILRTCKLTCRVIECIFFKTLEGSAAGLSQGDLGPYVITAGNSAREPGCLSLYRYLFSGLEDIGVGCVDLEPVGLYCFNM